LEKTGAAQTGHGATKWGNFGWKRGIANDPNFQPSISAFLLIIGDSNYQ
jgi:hypothetical protein